MNTTYVTSLELSHQLADAGVRQVSEFYWYNSMATGGKWILVDKKGFTTPIEDLLKQGNLISAFLACELMEMLPRKIWKYGKEYWWYCWPFDKNKWACRIPLVSSESYIGSLNDFNDKSLPNALAKMLLYLIEQGVVKV